MQEVNVDAVNCAVDYAVIVTYITPPLSAEMFVKDESVTINCSVEVNAAEIRPPFLPDKHNFSKLQSVTVAFKLDKEMSDSLNATDSIAGAAV